MTRSEVKTELKTVKPGQKHLHELIYNSFPSLVIGFIFQLTVFPSFAMSLVGTYMGVLYKFLSTFHYVSNQGGIKDISPVPVNLLSILTSK